MTYPGWFRLLGPVGAGPFSANQMVIKFGGVQNNICFVVSGALKETTYQPLQEGQKVRQKSTTDLVENDFLAGPHPFEDERISQSDVETITRVELVTISKSRLKVVCEKMPRASSSG